MKSFISKIMLLVISVVLLQGCKSNQEVAQPMSAMSGETVSLGSRGDGSIVLRCWGSGSNRGDAIEQAKRNAVYDILFKGIKSGPNIGDAANPLVPEVNARERYANYFDPFFSPGGEYKKFVKEEKGNADRLKSEGLSRNGYGVVVIVDRSALKAQLKKDGVLK